MRRHKRPLHINSSINITNLLDICFVLLICFMIIAPILKHGLNIDIPKVNPVNIQQPDKQDKKKSFDIMIKKKANSPIEAIFTMNDKEMSIEEIQNVLTKEHEKNPKVDVFIDSEKDAPYDAFVRTLGAVKNSGVTNIGIMSNNDEGTK